MKKKSTLLLSLFAASLIAVPLSVSLSSCNNGGTNDVVKENYVVDWKVVLTQSGEDKNNPTSLEGFVNETASLRGVVIQSTIEDKEAECTFTFESDDEDIATISKTGEIEFLNEGTTTITVKASNLDPEDAGAIKKRSINVTVKPARTATGVKSFAADSYYDKLQILGTLEDYAINNHLTGLTLFENGGKMVYSKRVKIPTKNEQYIPGYGFGILSDGELVGDNLDENGNVVPDSEFPTFNGVNLAKYYHSAIGTGATNLCYLDDQGSLTADLYSYISTGLYGTQLNESKDGYVWTNLLAKGKSSTNPIPVSLESNYVGSDGYVDNSKVTELDPNTGSGLFSNYKIYVKTGKGDKLKYSTASTNPKITVFNGRGVELDDYITAYKNILTKKNDYYRGAEMTSLTSTGTLKGALQYYQASGNGYNEAAWNNVGLKKGIDEDGEYLIFSLVNPTTPFYAKYTLSSNLVSPIPQDFLDVMAGGVKYGTPVDYLKGGSKFDNIVDTYLSLGAYNCSVFDPNGSAKAIVYVKNDNYQVVEPGKYTKIPGIFLSMMDNSSDSDLYVKQFKAGMLDAAGLTKNTLNDAFTNNGQKKTTVGDSTFKLNINSCTKETWEKLFGVNGTVYQNSTSSYWETKPWMANDNFLNAISFAINRKEYAEQRGNNPSVSYFSDSYQWDPEGYEASENKVSASYNGTKNHKDNLTNFFGSNYETNYGYNLEASKTLFRNAINEMVSKREITLPRKAQIKIQWMNTGDEKEYGADLKKYIETACNDVSVSNGQFTLEVVNIDGTSDYTKVYDMMRQGQFDLAFGSISGNTLNPLEFMEVLKSDNSSGFTLNYGADTSLPDSSLVYKDQVWSYDSLWTAAVKGAIIDEKGIVNPSPVKQVSASSKTVGENTIFTILVKIVDMAVIELTNEGAIASIGYKENASDTATLTYTLPLEQNQFIITKHESEGTAELKISIPNSFTTEKQDGTSLTVNFSEYKSIEVMQNYEVNIETAKGVVSSMSAYTMRLK